MGKSMAEGLSEAEARLQPTIIPSPPLCSPGIRVGISECWQFPFEGLAQFPAAYTNGVLSTEPRF